MTADRHKKPRVIVEMEPEFIERIEDWRYANRVPTRAEAIRRLIEAGLQKAKPDAAN